jgi:hypothetical protein
VTVEVHISKKTIVGNRRLGSNLPYIQAVNPATRVTAYGHHVDFAGPSSLTHRTRPDGEEHVYMETNSRVRVVDENTHKEWTVEP